MNRQLSEIARWRLVSEICRRYPNRLRVAETHLSSQQPYDCLALYDDSQQQIKAHFDREGGLTMPQANQSVRQEWSHFLEDPKWMRNHICDQLGLPKVHKTPSSTPRVLVYRFIATFLTHATLGIHPWECRGSVLDPAGYGGGMVKDFDAFPGALHRLKIRIDQDRLDPAHRFWFIRKNGFPLVCLETTGLVWMHAAPLAMDLMDLYNKNNRNIWSTVVSTAGFLMA